MPDDTPIEPRIVDALLAHAAAANAISDLAGTSHVAELLASLDAVLADQLVALGVDAETLASAMAALAIGVCRAPRLT
jgi:hypothetical protein